MQDYPSLSHTVLCDQIIQKDLYVEGLRNVYSTSVSKHGMLVALNERYDLNMTIEPFTHPISIDRTLLSVHNFVNELEIPDFGEMVKQL